MDWKGKNILVMGLGKSGVAVTRFLTEAGARVTVTDAKPAEKLQGVLGPLAELGVDLEVGKEVSLADKHIDLIVVSPGVPLTVSPLPQAKLAGIPIMGELELAYGRSLAPFVAITGTNGKTTTTSLVGQMLTDAGIPNLVGGNIGRPLVEEVALLTPQHRVVAEVSSFQLETIRDFHPLVAAILNITPDHLDRHGDMEGYIKAKARIFENQAREDFTVLNYDDLPTRELSARTSGQVVFFSCKELLDSGAFLRGDQVVFRWNGEEREICLREEIFLPGPHNLENALAAVAMGAVLGLTAAQMAHTLRTFPGVAHRLEFVADIGGVRYINDSKGTNPDSTMKALDSYTQPIILIAGGKNKGSDFGELAVRITERVKALVLVGQAAEVIEEAVAKIGYRSIHRVDTFPETVSVASRLAAPGDIVLLSPACASWDMFNNFEERGELFKKLVLSLRG